MRILMALRSVFPTPGQGGAENYGYIFAQHLAGLGHEVHMIGNFSPKHSPQKNLILHELNVPTLPTFDVHSWAVRHTVCSLYTFNKAYQMLKHNDWGFDVIHTHAQLSGLLCSLSRKGVRHVHTLHDPTPYIVRYESRYEQWLRRIHFRLIDLRLYRQADRLTVATQGIKDGLLTWGIEAEKIVLISNGVDTEFFKPNPDNRDNPRYDCLFVGALTPRKGVKYLLQALQPLNLSCIIVGDGRERRRLESLAARLGLESRVEFTGRLPQEKVVELYTSSRCLVLPSMAEIFPQVFLEAMACGLPVVAFDFPGYKELIVDGYNGFLVSPRDVDDLGQKIGFICENHEKRELMGLNAVQTIAEGGYSWDALTRKLVSVYENIN